MKNGKLHQGHRQRLKEKVKNNGLKSLSTHEVLELLLTYAIPYKDTNELAHRLLKNYGTFANVLNTSREELVTVDGIGEETALFLSTLPSYFQLYQETLSDGIIKLKTVASCVQFFFENIGIEKNEKSYLVFTDSQDKFLRTVELSEGDSFQTSVDRDKLSKLLATVKSKHIILFHTHPNGSVLPSIEDISATKSIVAISRLLGVELLDHIIVNQCEYYSFRNSNTLMELNIEMERKINDVIPSTLRENQRPYKYIEDNTNK